MAKYSDIKGFTVQTLSSDPAASIVATGSWTSGTSMPSISGGRGMAGAYHSSIAYGGTGSPPTAAQGKTEYFDGTSWTEQNDLNTARFMGCPAKQGTQTAALFAAGSTGNDNANVRLKVTTNNSSYTEVAQANDGNTSSTSFRNGSGTISYFVDVTDTSNVKVKFSIRATQDCYFKGASDNNENSFTFIRLGDT